MLGGYESVARQMQDQSFGTTLPSRMQRTEPARTPMHIQGSAPTTPRDVPTTLEMADDLELAAAKIAFDATRQHVRPTITWHVRWAFF